MKTLDRLDHEEAREGLALFSGRKPRRKGVTLTLFLQLQRTWSPRPSCADATLRKEAERIANDVAAKLSETIARCWS